MRSKMWNILRAIITIMCFVLFITSTIATGRTGEMKHLVVAILCGLGSVVSIVNWVLAVNWRIKSLSESVKDTVEILDKYQTIVGNLIKVVRETQDLAIRTQKRMTTLEGIIVKISGIEKK